MARRCSTSLNKMTIARHWKLQAHRHAVAAGSSSWPSDSWFEAFSQAAQEPGRRRTRRAEPERLDVARASMILAEYIVEPQVDTGEGRTVPATAGLVINGRGGLLGPGKQKREERYFQYHTGHG